MFLYQSCKLRRLTPGCMIGKLLRSSRVKLMNRHGI